MLEARSRELGRIIGQSPEYQALKRANEGLDADRDTVALLRRMEQLRVDAQRMLDRGQEPTEAMERELDELLGKVQTSTAYQHAVSAQENFDKIMLQVNSWIADGIKTGATSSIITLG
jgi:cell fate (sporulation/competence/biofilm development) regulator YlbF (YheA/YmcA/DUF963 family)